MPNCLYSCVFCQGGHFNDDDQYKESADCKQQLLSQGHCFLCLKTGNIFRDCNLVFSKLKLVSVVKGNKLIF